MRCRIQGDSMRPSFCDGDIAYVRRVKSGAIKQGDVVLFQHPFQPALAIKRVAEITEDGRFDLRGDNPTESSDSRSYGPIRFDKVLGVVCGTQQMPSEKL
ncbi:S24/S26 family peptidase [Planctomycetota bacterium]|nr:S24/S26 family peptidase [Planctomycetota bacterium]